MQKMLNTCKEVYDVLDIVEPGISRSKGICCSYAAFNNAFLCRKIVRVFIITANIDFRYNVI